MGLIQLTLSEPIPDLKCMSCQKVHKYDGDDWEGCLVIKDTRFIPPQVGCWCDEKCFAEWLNSPDAKEFLPPQYQRS